METLTHIETREDYARYEKRFRSFIQTEGIRDLSPDGDGETWFSWRPCECCGRPLGGDREKASGYNPSTGEVQTYEICTDCVYYSCYGQLDDLTMLNIGRTDLIEPLR